MVGGEGKWNELEIVCQGAEIRVTIAGQRINRYDQLEVPSGVIGFKIPENAPDGFEIKFEDILISPVS